MIAITNVPKKYDIIELSQICNGDTLLDSKGDIFIAYKTSAGLEFLCILKDGSLVHYDRHEAKIVMFVKRIDLDIAWKDVK